MQRTDKPARFSVLLSISPLDTPPQYDKVIELCFGTDWSKAFSCFFSF